MTICNGLDTGSWKDLYQYVLFESDLNKLPKRIAEAETALVIRARELSHAAGDDIQEEECLDYGTPGTFPTISTFRSSRPSTISSPPPSSDMN
jgi:hypothetical protein